MHGQLAMVAHALIVLAHDLRKKTSLLTNSTLMDNSLKFLYA